MADIQKLDVLTPDQIASGQQVRVHQKIKETSSKGEEKERIQVFEGLVMNVRGSGAGKTMTVRKVTEGVGVERIFPLSAPMIDKIELVKSFKTARKVLGFIRDTKKRLKEIKKAPTVTKK